MSFINLSNAYISYQRESDTSQFIAITCTHPTLAQIKYSIKLYIVNPTIKCSLAQTTDGGETWDTLWYITKN